MLKSRVRSIRLGMVVLGLHFVMLKVGVFMMVVGRMILVMLLLVIMIIRMLLRSRTCDRLSILDV